MLAIYARVSSERQEKAGTVENQLIQADKYIAANGIKEYEKYIDDGITGTQEDFSNRPALMKMIDDVKKGKIEAVWTYDLNRLARKQLASLTILSILKKKKVRFISENGEMDLNNPTDILIANIFGSFAEYEVELIKMRTGLGRARKMNEGDYAKPSMYGYEKYKENGKTKFRIKEDEAQIMRHIYKGYLEGKNLRQMKQYVISSGMVSWYNMYILLKNPVYKGFVYNTSKELVKSKIYEPIVSVETWDKVNEIIAENGKRWKSQFKRAKHLGSGLISCAYCGQKFYRDKVKKDGRENYYYRHLRLSHVAQCSHKGSTIQQELFDNIIDFVFRYSFMNTLMLKHNFGELQNKLKNLDEENNEEISVLNRSIEDNKKKMNNILKAIEDGIDAAMFKEKAIAYQDGIKKAEKRKEEIIEGLSTKKGEIEGEIEAFKKNRLEEYQKANIEEKRKLINELIISSIKIDYVMIVSTRYNRHFIFDTRAKNQNKEISIEAENLVETMMNRMGIVDDDATINAIIEKQKREPYHFEVYDIRKTEDEINELQAIQKKEAEAMTKARKAKERRA